MGRLARLAGERTHTRTIEVSTFVVDDSHILSSGHFKDVRAFPSLGLVGEGFEAGTLHDLEVHILMATPALVIEDIEVAINTVPLEDCRALEHSLDAVIGQSISRGFTGRVKALAGGKTGCTHLVHLLTTMAPAVLQGYWALLDSTKVHAEDRTTERASSSAMFLKDSCYAWREDGVTFRALRNTIEKGTSADDGA